MTRYNAANNWETTLDGGINDAVTSVAVVDATGHPTEPFKITVEKEIMNVTNVAGNTLTVVRGQEGTVAAAHDSGAVVENRLTAEVQNDLWDAVDGKSATVHNLVDTTNHPVSGLTGGHVLTASGATTYGFSPVHTFKNKLINGNFDIWQRGTTLSGNGYLADRWENHASGATIDSAQQTFTVGQTDVSGEPHYFHRAVVVAGSNAGDYAQTYQSIESVRTCAGQTVTVSFYAKADASKNMSIEFAQLFGSGGSPSGRVDAIGVEKFALTTAWQKFTKTVAIPSITGKTLGTTHDGSLVFHFHYSAGSDLNDRTDTLGHQSGTFDIAQVQVELGSVATPFEHRPIGLEELLCYRYYIKVTPNGFPGYYHSEASRGQLHVYQVSFPCSMRITPTANVTANYSGCTHHDLRWSVTEIIHRVDKDESTGRYRVQEPTYTADAEF